MRLFNIFVVAAVVSAGQNRNDDDIDAGESKKFNLFQMIVWTGHRPVSPDDKNSPN